VVGGAGCTIHQLLDEGGVSRVDLDVIDVIVDFVVLSSSSLVRRRWLCRCRVVFVVVGIDVGGMSRSCWNRHGEDVA